MPKLKKFELHWTATISGVKIVEAFDEKDAEEQFDPILDMGDIETGNDGGQIHADLDFIHEVKPMRGKK